MDVAAAAMPLARHLERAGALVAGGARVVAAQALREVLPVKKFDNLLEVLDYFEGK